MAFPEEEEEDNVDEPKPLDEATDSCSGEETEKEEQDEDKELINYFQSTFIWNFLIERRTFRGILKKTDLEG